MKNIITSIVFILWATIGFSQSVNTKKLDSLFNSLDTNNKAMGSIAIAKNGIIVYKHVFGYADLSQKLLANPETEYQIGSITKMYTATMIFQLIDEGRLSLETPLSKFFAAIPNSKEITIKLLLNHRSGLYDFVNDTKDVSFLTKPHSKQELINIIKNQKPHFTPDSTMEYSNSGYLFLSYIIEKITGKKYSDALQERICEKLHLKHTFCSDPGNKNIAKSYSVESNGWQEVNDFYFPNVQGVGDIVSTPTEMIKFNEALLNGDLISKASLDSMKTVSKGQFCTGIMKIPFDEKTGYGHGGDTYGTHSILATFIADSLSIAFCDNAEAYSHNEIVIRVLSICFNNEYKIPDFKSFKNKTEDLDKYLGVYSSKEIPLKITITKDGTNLIAQATGQEAGQLKSTAKDKFELYQAGATFEFNTSEHQMTLLQGGNTILFTKDK